MTENEKGLGDSLCLVSFKLKEIVYALLGRNGINGFL